MATFQRRAELRQRKGTVVEVSNTASTSDCEMVCVDATERAISQDSDVNKGIQTHNTSNDIENLEIECRNLRSENLQLKQDYQLLHLKIFEGNNDKVQVYAGLQSYEIMLSMFNHITPELYDRTILTPFKQFLLTCMKLLLDLSMPYLAQIFGVHKLTVSCMFEHVLGVMNTFLVPLLLFWPSRESLSITIILFWYPCCSFGRVGSH